VPTTRAFVYMNGSMYNLTFTILHRDLNVRLVNAVGISCMDGSRPTAYDISQPNVNRVYVLVPAANPLRVDVRVPDSWRAAPVRRARIGRPGPAQWLLAAADGFGPTNAPRVG
jgi:hypothetical protein